MTRASALAAVLLVALAPTAAAGDDESPPAKRYRIFGQLTTELELNQAEDENDPEDGDYTKLKQIVAVNLEWSKLTVGVQLELLDYSDPELVDRLDLDRLHDTLELRRYYVDYQGDHLSGRLGTFFSSLGRGLTLYVQKNDVLGFDEPIHGAFAKLNLEHFDISAVGGTVTEPQLQNQFNREFEDEVYGGRVIARLPLDLYLGGSAVRAELDRFFPEGTDEVEVWSAEGGGTGLFGLLDIAAEWSELTKTEATRVRDGYGRYFSAAAYVGPVSILAEYKDYYNFAYRYNLPPNAGRADESYDHNDVKGPRLLVSADILATGSIVHGSYAEFDSHRTSSSPGGTEGDRQTEWYAGLEQTIGRVYFQGSYFDRDWLDRGITETHTIGDFHLTVGGSGEIILGWDERLEEADYFSLGTTRTTAAYSLSPWGTVSLRYSWEERSGFDKEDFWGVEVQALPRSDLIITLFGGGDPGGLVCAGGQCRIEPRFKGYRANITWRF
ncbi:MAG: DUF6029 family protein [Thermoanaerobaculales bacterium]|nr:DUF6029 family protein [Thermoanaerobaculales bacterium]